MSYEIPLHILQPAFVLMADATRFSPDEETLHRYAQTWGSERLQPAAILHAVNDILRNWESGRWPSASLIATRARQILRDDEDYLAGQRESVNRLNDLCDVAAQQRWDDRRDRARAWITTHRDLLPAIEAEVDATGRTHVDRFGLRDDLVQPMGAAFREGALVGACLELERLERTTAGKDRIDALREQSRRLTGMAVAA